MARKELTLAERLQRFVRNWQGRIHDDLKEKSAAQSFCKELIECYGARYQCRSPRRRGCRQDGSAPTSASR